MLSNGPDSMHHPSLTPSCCAGLRQTLMQGWQNAFPLHPSPFRQMAAASGSTPRELLTTCLALQRDGALQPIRARWGVAMRRMRWRLAFAERDMALLLPVLAQLPGCLRIERVDRTQPGALCGCEPAVWAEFEALDEAALQRQLDLLPHPPVARLAWPPMSSVGMDVAPEDIRLAAFAEHGFKLCSRPFADCARHLDCSEQRVLAVLQGWRRTGQLECLTLKPPPARGAQPGVLALWHDLPASGEFVQRLRAQPNVDRVVARDGTGSALGWPWALSVVLHAPPALALDRLRELRQASGLPSKPDACLPVRIELPRDEARLFDGAVLAAPAAQTRH